MSLSSAYMDYMAQGLNSFVKISTDSLAGCSCSSKLPSGGDALRKLLLLCPKPAGDDGKELDRYNEDCLNGICTKCFNRTAENENRPWEWLPNLRYCFCDHLCDHWSWETAKDSSNWLKFSFMKLVKFEEEQHNGEANTTTDFRRSDTTLIAFFQ